MLVDEILVQCVRDSQQCSMVILFLGMPVCIFRFGCKVCSPGPPKGAEALVHRRILVAVSRRLADENMKCPLSASVFAIGFIVVQFEKGQP